MMVARWQFKARFGMKQAAIDAVKEWWQTVGAGIGQTDCTIMTGSIGAEEALVTVNVRVDDLTALNEQWERLAQRDDHKQWGERFEPLIVSGSTRWEIFRIVG